MKNKTKQDHLEDLIEIAYRIDNYFQLQQDRSDRLKRMTQLSRQGLKETEEFKILDREFKNPFFVGNQECFEDLRRKVKQIKNYKFSAKN